MIISGLDTREAAMQLENIFDINAIFKRRGLEVIEYEGDDELLFNNKPTARWTTGPESYKALESGSFRRVVSCVADSRIAQSADDIRNAYGDLTKKQVVGYLEQAVNLGFIGKDGEKYKRTKQTGFGSTFEWYVASVCIKELASIAYWGVKVKGMEGDYDVVLIRENQIGYIECKRTV